MRVGIRVDAGPVIGGGHVMRCLTLANALTERGADVTFVTAAMPEALRRRIVAAGHDLVERPALPELERTGPNWHEPPLGGDVQLEDVTAAEAGVGAVDWLIVDHYLLDARWHSAARRFAGNVLVIDDLANRTYDCDLLLDQTLGRSASDYDGLVPEAAKVLAGASYAMLRPEFVRERAAALGRRQEAGDLHRILVSMGTGDPGGITATVVDVVAAVASQSMIDVVLAPEAPSLAHARSLAAARPNVTLHVDSDRMAELMRDADLAIGGAGTTSWERCCLGLPAIALVLADNQRGGAAALDEAGAAVAVESVDQIAPALNALLTSPERLSRMSAAALAIIDGLGTSRVVGAMLDRPGTTGTEVELRRATIDDAEMLWLWRNDPITRAQSRNSEPIVWADHVSWLTRALGNPDRRIFIAEQEGTPAGTIRFDRLADQDADEVSIAVAPGQRGTGIGGTMLKAVCAETHSRAIRATVRADNQASRRLFESCGFALQGSAEPGFLRYVRQVEDQATGRRKQA